MIAGDRYLVIAGSLSTTVKYSHRSCPRMIIRMKQFSSLYYVVLICLLSPFVTLGFHSNKAIPRPSLRPLVVSSPAGSTTSPSATVSTDFPEETKGFNKNLEVKSTSTIISAELDEELLAIKTTTEKTTTSSSLNNAVTAKSNKKTSTKRRPALPTTCVIKKYAVTLTSMTIIATGSWITTLNFLALSGQALRIRRNILAGSIIFTVGDIGAQVLTYWSNLRQQQLSSSPENKMVTTFPSFTLDQQRLTISTILGILWAGITVPSIYDSIERLLPGNQGGVGRIVLKMVLSCGILSTAGNYSTMFFRRFVIKMCDLLVVAVTRKGKTATTSRWWSAARCRWKDCVKSCNRDFLGVLMDDMKVWPLYDIMCFAVIPPFIRPIATAIMSSLWSMYMSIVSATTTEAAE